MIYGLDLLGQESDGIIMVTRPPGGIGSRTGPPGVLVHAAHLPRDHLTARAGVPITSVARTVVDPARSLPFTAAVVAADSALRTKQVTKPELYAVLTACERWPGIRRARRVVAFSDGRSESVFESIARVAFDEQGLPAPDLQVWVGGEDEVVGRVTSSGARTGRSVRLTVRASTPTQDAFELSCGGMRGYVRQALRSCISPGTRSGSCHSRWPSYPAETSVSLPGSNTQPDAKLP